MTRHNYNWSNKEVFITFRQWLKNISLWIVLEWYLKRLDHKKNSASYRRGSFFCKLAMHPALQISKNRNLFELLQLRWNFLRKPTRNYPDYFQKRTYISAVARSLMLLRPPKIFLLLYSVCEKHFQLRDGKKVRANFVPFSPDLIAISVPFWWWYDTPSTS